MENDQSVQKEIGLKLSKITYKKTKNLIIFSSILIFVCKILEQPANATFGYFFIGLLFTLIGYSLSIALLALLISAILKKIKTHFFIVFGWLFLSATILDLVVQVCKMIILYRIENVL